jgi:hypothetical protein
MCAQRTAANGATLSPERMLAKDRNPPIADGPKRQIFTTRIVLSATNRSRLRHGEDGAWRCETAQRMRSERYQRYPGLGGECARDMDVLAERPAQPLQPADQVHVNVHIVLLPCGGPDAGADLQLWEAVR